MAIDDAGTDPNVGWVKTLSCHGAGVIIGLVYPLLHVNSVDSPFAGSLPSLFVLFDCFLLPAIDHILMKSKVNTVVMYCFAFSYLCVLTAGNIGFN